MTEFAVMLSVVAIVVLVSAMFSVLSSALDLLSEYDAGDEQAKEKESP
ncbi:MAG: hypothetical protein MJZ81_07210 [Bacteroidales bacterium]|nr:hypothetical protein [Bacteroidales bacterium]